jgi:hypothetical protein
MSALSWSSQALPLSFIFVDMQKDIKAIEAASHLVTSDAVLPALTNLFPFLGNYRFLFNCPLAPAEPNGTLGPCFVGLRVYPYRDTWKKGFRDMTLITAIQHLNDHHRRSREWIADWIDTLPLNLTTTTTTKKEPKYDHAIGENQVIQLEQTEYGKWVLSPEHINLSVVPFKASENSGGDDSTD